MLRILDGDDDDRRVSLSVWLKRGKDGRWSGGDWFLGNRSALDAVHDRGESDAFEAAIVEAVHDLVGEIADGRRVVN